MKELIKLAARTFAVVCVSPLLLTQYLSSRVSSPDAALEAHSQLLSLIPGAVGSYLRVAFYRFVLKQCAPTATIGFGVLFSRVDAEIREHAYVGPRCMIGTVTIEEDVLLGPAVQIPSGPNLHGTQRLDIPIREQPENPFA